MVAPPHPRSSPPSRSSAPGATGTGTGPGTRTTGTGGTTSGSSLLVIEIGTSRIRCGYSGESTPRHILPTPPDVAGAFASPLPAEEVDALVVHAGPSSSPDDHEEKERRGRLAAVARQRTEEEWYDLLDPLLHEVVFDRLLASRVKTRRVLLLLPQPSAPTTMRLALCRVLVDNVGVASVRFASGMGATLLLTGRSCGMVLDVGRNEARCAAYFGGEVVPQTFQAVPCGYETAVRAFQRHPSVPEELRPDGHGPNGPGRAFEDACSVLHAASWHPHFSAPPADDDDASSSSAGTVECALPSTGKTISVPVACVRSAWDETFFDASDANSLPHLLLSALRATPLDLRRVVASNVLVAGGGAAALPDFGERLVRGAERGASEVGRFRGLRRCVADSLAVAGPPFATASRCWTGASVLGTILEDEDDDGERWITRKAWIEYRGNRGRKMGEGGGGTSPSMLLPALHEGDSIGIGIGVGGS